MVLMDFSKAFDKVPHRRLLTKLHHYGIRGQVLKWIEVFLTTRHQRVLVDGEASDYVHVKSGVPQGTVLGPLLFLMFINDLPDEVVSRVRLFADDAVLYRKINSSEDCVTLQKDLDILLKWEEKWQMSFHPQKCMVLRVTRSRKPVNHTYHLRETELASVSHAAYLGTELDDKLTWTKHIDQTTAKASRTLNFVRRNLRVASQHVKETAYKSLVRPSLDYACTVWDPHTQTQIRQVEMVQRRAARFVSNRHHNTSSVTEMLTDLRWETLQERRAKFRVVMMFKIVHCLVAIPIAPYLQPVQGATRHHHDQSFLQQSASTKYLQNSYFYRTIPTWNCLPVGIVEAGTLDLFKARLARHAMPASM